MVKTIGTRGRTDLEHALQACGVARGFERGFAGLARRRVVGDLGDLTEVEAERVRTHARRLAEYESGARQKEADAVQLSNAEMIAQGSEWLGLSF